MSILEKIDKKEKLICGIGSALVDVLVKIDDSFLEKIKAAKGGMTLVDNDFIEKTLQEISAKPSVVPGGATCNTIIGIGKLGGKARFVGKRGEDELGELLEVDLKKNNVEPQLFSSTLPTGRVLSLITPDAQRTMFTYLGAASELLSVEVTKECFENAALVMIEGYLLFNRDLMMSALKAAKEAGALVVMDLASFTVVEAALDFLKEEVMSYVDIVIANEDEARAFTGHTEELKALEVLSGYAEMAVLKVGRKGSYIAYQGEVTQISPKGDGKAVDTTGAGDLWASGFLSGLIKGYSLEKSGELASACGYEVCQVVGANISEEGWARIKKVLV